MRLLWWVCSLAHFTSLVSAEGDCTVHWAPACYPENYLTASRTAVVHFYNGTVFEVAKIQGSPEYLELMARLATSKPSPQPTLNFMREIQISSRLMEYLFPSRSSPWRDWWRWLNMKMGRPIKADDVEIISDLLQELKVATEKTIFQPLDRVAVTEPGFQSLDSETTNAALRILGLRTWVRDSVYYTSRLVEGDAVYAANGYGLCTNYEDRFQCSDEFEGSSIPTVFVVSYNHNLLYTSIMDLISGEAFPYGSTLEAQLVDYELGLDSLLENDQGQPVLVDRLRSQLQILPRESKIYGHAYLLSRRERHTPPFPGYSQGLYVRTLA
ncbi:hypothetical protein N7444_012972 [Penicillium canescens]|nr:hypothetical protein N7444_012972 [Penicillium canescens]